MYDKKKEGEDFKKQEMKSEYLDQPTGHKYIKDAMKHWKRLTLAKLHGFHQIA
jgi:hypothetical protein